MHDSGEYRLNLVDIDIDIASGRITPQAVSDDYRNVWQSAVFSPDGRMVATVGTHTPGRIFLGRDRLSIALWETASWSLIGYPAKRELLAESYDPWSLTNSMAFSSNGQLFAASFASQDRSSVVLCDTRRPLASEIAGEFRCQGMAFSPDCRVLALAHEGQVIFWDISARRQVIPPLKGSANYPKRPYSGKLLFSRDGHTLATLTADALILNKSWTARLWKMPGGGPVSPDIPVSQYTDTAFSPGGRLFVAQSPESGRLLVWDTVAGQPSAQGINERVDRFASSPGGRMLATVDREASVVHLWGL